MTTRHLHHTHRRALCALVAAALLAACGGTDDGTPPDDASSGGASPTASPSPSSPSPSSPSPSSLSPASPAAGTSSTAAATASGCEPRADDPPAEVPNGAEHVAEATGDLDGDGADDRLVTWSVTLGDGQVDHRLRVVTASGRVAEAALDRAGSMADVRPLGTVPVGDGVSGALVVEDVGASSEQVSLWGLHAFDDDPCSLGRLTVADDSYPVTFPVGATAATKVGLRCHEVDGTPTLTVRTATVDPEDDRQFDWQSADLVWTGAGALQMVSRDTGTVAAAEVDGYGTIACPGISLG